MTYQVVYRFGISVRWTRSEREAAKPLSVSLHQLVSNNHLLLLQTTFCQFLQQVVEKKIFMGVSEMFLHIVTVCASTIVFI
jgi:hypothetical protein